MKLAKRVAVITGAGRNIGEAIAETLAAEGASVAVVDLDAQLGAQVAQKLRDQFGVEAESYVCDVAQPEQIEQTTAAIVKRFGGIDILVNNVAMSDNKHILEISLEQWQRTMDITLTAPFYFSQCVAKTMVEQKRTGNIVNVTSTSGYFGRSRAIAYTAAKGGVVNLTRSMAVQLAEHGIRVNSVVPNKIGSPVGKDTFDPTRPVVNLRNRTGVPMDLAKAVLFLVSDDSDFIAGADLFVDGGCSVMMPGN